MEKQVRFYAYLDGPCFIELKSGEEFEWSTGGPHEEGYSYQGADFYFDGEVVYREDWSYARDCDGPISTASKSHCPVEQLNKGMQAVEYLDEEGPRFFTWNHPAWTKGETIVNDTYARMMNY